MEDRFELTLLDRREDIDPRFARLPVFLPEVTLGVLLLIPRLIVPPRRPVAGLVPALPMFGGYARLCGASGGGGSLRLPFASSLNHIRNAVRRLARLRLLLILTVFSPIVDNAPMEFPGELAGVGGGDPRACVRTQGEPIVAEAGIEAEGRGGVPGSSFRGFRGGDLSNLLELA